MRLATYLGPIARVVANRAAQEGFDIGRIVQLVAGHLGAQDQTPSCAKSGSTTKAVRPGSAPRPTLDLFRRRNARVAGQR
jgi:hypothetical protein